jgi:hypothetical protein
MGIDYMIGDSYGKNIISDITLALFEDSGWYEVDYSMSNLFLWGKGQGCGFLDVNTRCIKYDDDGKLKAAFPEFCDKPNYPVCSHGGDFRAICKVKQYPFKLNSFESYFKDPNVGGADPLTDRCPIANENKNGQMYYGGSCKVGTINNIDKLEDIGPQSACFMSSLRHKKRRFRFKSISRLDLNATDIEGRTKNKTEYDIPQLEENDYDAKCYHYTCDEDGTLRVQIGDERFKCSQVGKTYVEGYDGVIMCPPKDILCHPKKDCKFGCVEKYSTNIK